MLRPYIVLFDWDLTLVDRSGSITHSLNKVFQAMNMRQWTTQETQQNMHHSIRNAFPQYFGEQWQMAEKIFYDALYETMARDSYQSDQIIPGSAELLEFLKDQGVILGVVSNKYGPDLRKEIQNMGWQHYFSAIVGAGDAENDKPSPDPIFLALQQMMDIVDRSSTAKVGATGYGAKPVWFVGDSPTDVEAARAAGCKAVLINHTKLSPERFQSCPPDQIMNSMVEFYQYCHDLFEQNKPLQQEKSDAA